MVTMLCISGEALSALVEAQGGDATTSAAQPQCGLGTAPLPQNSYWSIFAHASTSFDLNRPLSIPETALEDLSTRLPSTTSFERMKLVSRLLQSPQ